MKPTKETLKSACPEVDEKFIEQHLLRLDNVYFQSFDHEQLCRHLCGLAFLSPRHPVDVLIKAKGNGHVDCTVLAFDYPSEFSLITGVLTGMGFSIMSGVVFTYARAARIPAKNLPRRRPGRSRTSLLDPMRRRRIVDHFSGTVDTSLSFDSWARQLQDKMREIISLLEREDKDSVNEAKSRVNEMVAEKLSDFGIDSHAGLYPVHIEVDNESGSYTRLKVVSDDTPAFLYSLTNALSLHDISIEHVTIRTIKNRIRDEIDLVDSRGHKIEDSEVLDRVKLSVLLTKQFTFFLGRAPDPYTALCRFDTLVEEILKLPGNEKERLELLSNPLALQDLARLLGTSDFLWEDFIRLQHETLLPMLGPRVDRQRFSSPIQILKQNLDTTLSKTSLIEEKYRLLNEFKDREIFLVDLDHILNPDVDFNVFAEKLTSLAELVVNRAVDLAYEHLINRFGTPRTIAGMEVTFAILGLGKLGGAALGYASDIELLFVYSDNGKTDGKDPIENSEFFNYLVRETLKAIHAKREGIFHIDLRLRPYGNAGPLACSLESFCRYYGPGGQSHSYERLALVRLRAIGGEKALQSRVERLRDEMIYASKNIDLKELRDLREKQFQEKTQGGKLNAKFSPGGLVDLEYDVQILQIMYGKDIPALRTPQIHKALLALKEAGVLPEEECKRLSAAYNFLRCLINGMRMLRGSAMDLFLPPVDSDEFVHLARRIGYKKEGMSEPAQQLYLDFETHTAAIRAFVKNHFGRDSLPGPAKGNVADLVLSENITQDISRQILSDAGFKDPERAYLNLKHLAGEKNRRDTFAKLAILACDILRRKPDPDMALNNWERFLGSLPDPEKHYETLLSQPMGLRILLTIFSGSQFLADTLIKNPEFLEWVTNPDNVHKLRIKKDMEEELAALSENCREHCEWLNELRRFRRREILRIGTRDIYLGVTTKEVMLELSLLAEAVTQAALERAWKDLEKNAKVPSENSDPLKYFCILAQGKLGGSELNYSSDIDLLGTYDDRAVRADFEQNQAGLFPPLFKKLMEKVRSDLSSHTEEGYAYRVDLRLRPYGSAGELVPSVSSLVRYSQNNASLWETQAALKMRPIAGNLDVGSDFLAQIREFLLLPRDSNDIVRSIDRMRRTAITIHSNLRGSGADVKSGPGGLRDIEFLVQGLQLIHGPSDPGLINGNTLEALDSLKDAQILPEAVSARLQEDYVFLRRVEHCLQILEDRQIHSIPQDPAELTALAKRVLGIESNAKEFTGQLNECLRRVREAYMTYLVNKY
ncbi:MAG: glutamate-ammonia-ligase adenylyltransferase [Thermodesulfobacteriota bacterium]|nr:glutamate-ammonia-ligase adenylyltransferase [Thermodesulfobacteriota bacterium]